MEIPVPIVRLEVQGMKYAVSAALTEYAAQQDEMIQQAVAEACDPARVAEVIYKTAREAIDAVLSQEIRNWFLYGDGRAAVKEKVTEILSQEL